MTIHLNMEVQLNIECDNFSHFIFLIFVMFFSQCIRNYIRTIIFTVLLDQNVCIFLYEINIYSLGKRKNVLPPCTIGVKFSTHPNFQFLLTEKYFRGGVRQTATARHQALARIKLVRKAKVRQLDHSEFFKKHHILRLQVPVKQDGCL